MRNWLARLKIRWKMWRNQQLGPVGRVFWGVTFWWVYAELRDPFYRSWNPRRAISVYRQNKEHEIYCMKAPRDEYEAMRDRCIGLERENTILKLDKTLLQLDRNTDERVRGMFGL